MTVLDTNIVLYLLAGKLAQPLPPGADGVSVITEMEVLSCSGLTATGEATIRQFLAGVALPAVSVPVRAIAIDLRRKRRLRLPDAIIAASAVHAGGELWTNDEGLSGTAGLRCRSLALKQG